MTSPDPTLSPCPAGSPADDNGTLPDSAPWRLARCLVELRSQVNAQWPHRDTASDGTIGDAAHAATVSDHNPNQYGVVRAWDITASSIPAADIAERLRLLGASGDHRLAHGGYVIFNRRIASWIHAPVWQWHDYTGADPHTSHIHLSVSQDPAGYDDGSVWNGVLAAEDPSPTLGLGLNNPPNKVNDVKRFLNSLPNNRLVEDGRYDNAMSKVVSTYKSHRGITEPGWGPKCWARARHEIAQRKAGN